MIAGLSKQLVNESNYISPGLFSSLYNKQGISLSTAAAAVPFLQTPCLSHLQSAVAQKGGTITINSALRTLPQQV